MDLQQLLKFIKLTHDFQAIERVIRIKNSERWENDVEHSYQLAMCAWYIVSVNKLPMDLDKIIRYALLHDLVEVYAGDTYIFDKDPAVLASKKQRESDALERLKDEFPEFPDLADTISEYEKRDNQESKFVYALDKIVAPINIYLDDGRTWKEMEVTLDQLIENKQDKVKEHPEIEKYFLQLKELFEQQQDQLFHKDNEKI